MGQWSSAQSYYFSDPDGSNKFKFDGSMWVGIQSVSETSPRVTKFEVHVGFKNRNKDVVMQSYEKMRQRFFELDIKAGRFYYKSSDEYVTVNIIERKEILHPKGKSYYVYLIMQTQDSLNIRQLKKSPVLKNITIADNIYEYNTEGKQVAPSPFVISLNINMPIEYIVASLAGGEFGLQYKLLAGDIVSIFSLDKKFEVKRGGRVVHVGYIDGKPSQIVPGKNVFSFRTNIESASSFLFSASVAVEERI